MNYENAGAGAGTGKTLRTVSGGIAGAATSRTLSERLESAANTINYQSNRIEDVLAKINGTPRAPQAADRAEKIAVTAPLTQSVDAVEQLAERLTNLASGLEQLA